MMSEERSFNAELGEWMVMSLEEGFHAYDTTSGLKWPPERSASGIGVHHVWRDGWNAPPEKQGASWLSIFRTKRQVTEQDYRRAHFVWILSTGQAEAIGYLLPRHEHDRAVLIPQEAWVNCNLDWDTGRLSGAGFEFAHVRVLMPDRSFLLKNGIYFPEPLPPLAPFEPSEAQRLLRGIPVSSNSGSSHASQPSPPGRPTLQNAIVDAFGSVDKDPNWTQKELCNAIRAHVKAAHGLLSDKGLGQKTIMRHVGRLWSDFIGQNL